LPVVLALANIAAPLAGATPRLNVPADVLTALPAGLWLVLPGLPLIAATIGCMTAQITVRRWLRRLP
jgi:cell division transport system permease protein